MIILSFLFQLEEDLLNYQEWISKKVTRPRLKPQVPNHLRNIDESPMPSASSLFDQEPDIISTQQHDKGILCIPEQHNKSIQVQPVMVHRLVGTRISRKRKLELEVLEEYSEEATPSAIGSTTDFTETESTNVLEIEKKLVGRNFMLNLIKTNPLAYIGVTKQCYWIVQYIEKQCKTPSLHIIVVLYKIKNNDTFARIKDLFEISIATLWRIFYKTLKVLKKFFMLLLFWPTAVDIKRNLPPVFRANEEYASVQIIIDCFEIEIEKPRKPINQALTWSQYKSCNTIKYLIGATPDGFINFVSEGYGGRISDMYLVEQSGFLEAVPQNATILADRGFKHLESHLAQKSVKVLRPPSVLKDVKMTKAEVIDSKVIASLRIHIERVIRRVRLFKLLKPHSVVNSKLINVLDDVVVVACGLINMQSPLIKSS